MKIYIIIAVEQVLVITSVAQMAPQILLKFFLCLVPNMINILSEKHKVHLRHTFY